jgi:polyisoprenoid-binding protein YceI
MEASEMKWRFASLPLLTALVVLSMTGVPGRTAASQKITAEKTANNDARTPHGNRGQVTARYRIVPDQSQFMVEAYSGGLLWFMGHTHHFAVRNFAGEAEVSPEMLEPASLQLTVKTDSLEETGKNFTEGQKKIINEGARKEVLQADAYPEIVFKSTGVKAKRSGGDRLEVEIGGDLTLHGVTRHVVIPAQVTFGKDSFRAGGEFSINRSDYGVKTHSIKGGLIRVRDKVKFTFDILANKH